IERAIQRAREYLLAQQKNGSWDLPAAAPEPKPNAKGEVNVLDIQNSSQWGGLTALATYALLAAGEDPTDRRMAAATEFIEKANLVGTYAIAMRAQVWNAMPIRRRAEFAKYAEK